MADFSGEAIPPNQLGDSSRKTPESGAHNPAPTSMQQPPSYLQSQHEPPATPYTVQPTAAPRTQRKSIKTSRDFDSNAMMDNQYFISIILCLVLTIFCNPCTLFCCIPAFFYASKAADENEKGNYEKALSHHTKAQWLNAGGFIFIVVGGVMFLILLIVGVTVGTVIATITTSDRT